jgi:hypothetical protein
MPKYGNLYDHKLSNIFSSHNNKYTTNNYVLYKNILHFFTFLNNNILG